MRPKILVVEDESIIAESLRRSLEASGYDVPPICSTAEAAIEAARTTAPDLVLMDIRLKGEKDGIYAARIVSEGYDVPVIYVTAYGDKADKPRKRKPKPMPLTPREKEILRLIAKGMANKEISAALAVSSRTVESHRAHILAKLKLKSAAELVRYAIRNGMVRT